MSPFNGSHPQSLLLAIGLGLLGVLASFVWQGHVGINLADEGFLWYGVQQVIAGEVPIRDFMAYDPGRYYWSAALMSAWGNDGLISLRLAVAVFQFLGLATGVWLVLGSQEKLPVWFIACVVLILLVWMFPRHKLFDVSLSILQIGMLTALLRRPVTSRFFLAGLALGLVAVFGRNHGLYGLLASFGALAWLLISQRASFSPVRDIFLWALGVCVGYAPLLAMLVFVPGFATAFWASILSLFEAQATNLPLPIPWPWLVDVAGQPISDAVRQIFVGVYFILIVAFGVGGLLWAFFQLLRKQSVPPALMACFLLSVPYSHYAFSRADVGHLAHGVFPLLVGALIICTRLSVPLKATIASMLVISSCWIMIVYHDGYRCTPAERCVQVSVSDDTILMDTFSAHRIKLMRELIDEYATDGQTFLVMPSWPGMYPIFKRKAPVWAVYALFPRSASFEEAEIARMDAAAPTFAVIYDHAQDGRDELRYRNTHPLLTEYINEHYDEIFDIKLEDHQFYRRKQLKP